jgi:hypothetical protein
MFGVDVAANPFLSNMVTRTSFVTSFQIPSPPFLNHVLISNWIAARSTAPPISTIKSISLLTACPI